MSFVHVPATLRRSPHQLSIATPPPRGLCGLSDRQAQAVRQGAQHLHALGVRALAEFLIEAAEHHADLPTMLEMLGAWRERLPVAMVGAAGADRFPARALREVG